MMIAIPAGGCESGGRGVTGTTGMTPGVCIKVGADIIGVPDASHDAGDAGNVTLHLCGVFGNMKLKTADAPAIGDKLYHDDGNSYLTTTSGGNVWAGWAMSEADTSGETTVVQLKLKC